MVDGHAGRAAAAVPLLLLQPVRPAQDLPDAGDPPVRAARDEPAAEHAADPDQRAGRRQPHARVAAARAARALHVPRGPRGGRQVAGAGRARALPGADLRAPVLRRAAADDRQSRRQQKQRQTVIGVRLV